MNIKQALLAFALAFLAESMVEYIFAAAFDVLSDTFPKVAQAQPLKYVALVVGVGMSFAYRLDLLNMAFEIVADPAWVGIALTGMAIGRGSNYVHDLWKRYLDPEQAEIVAMLGQK